MGAKSVRSFFSLTLFLNFWEEGETFDTIPEHCSLGVKDWRQRDIQDSQDHFLHSNAQRKHCGCTDFKLGGIDCLGRP